MKYFQHPRFRNKVHLRLAILSLFLVIVAIQSNTAYAEGTKSDKNLSVESSCPVEDDLTQLLNLWIASSNNSNKLKWAITQFQKESQPGISITSLSEISSATKDIDQNTEQLVSSFCEFRRRFDQLKKKSPEPERFVETWTKMPLLMAQKPSSMLLSGNDSYLLQCQHKLVTACGGNCISQFTEWCAKNPGSSSSYKTALLLPLFRQKVRTEILKGPSAAVD